MAGFAAQPVHAQAGLPRDVAVAIDIAAKRADSKALTAAVIDAIARYPQLVEQIVTAATREAPAYGLIIAAEASRAYPGFAERIARAVGRVTPETAHTAQTLAAAAAGDTAAAEERLPTPGIRQPHAGTPLEDFEIILGLGPALAPSYEGGTDYEVTGFPIIDITWRDRVFLRVERSASFLPHGRGLGVNIFKTRSFAAGSYLTYDPGRDDSEDGLLNGTGTIDGTLEGGIFAELTSARWRLSADYFQALMEDGHDGSRMVFSGAYGGRVSEQLGVSVGAAMTYASETYMQSYFGVTAQQAAASGRPALAASSGIKDITGRIDFRYSATEHWFGLLRSEWKRLMGDADETPLVDPESENQFFIGTAGG